MKLAVVALLALTALAHSRSVDYEDIPDIFSPYGYLEKYGVPLANSIREAEEAEFGKNPRIVGGVVSGNGQFPYQAGIVIQLPAAQTAVCGGSLLNNRRVLTAAHCWWDGNVRAQQFTIVLGSNRIFSGGLRIATRDIVMHGDWWPHIIRYDVALARLPRNIAFTNVIQPIALPTGAQLRENFVGQRAVASGFGRTRDGVPIPQNQVLHHVQVDVISNEVCARAPNFARAIHISNLCISGAGGRNVCHGDSGGPLAITRNNRPVLIGVTSFGNNAGCQAGFPAVFARVTYFDSWIRNRL